MQQQLHVAGAAMIATNAPLGKHFIAGDCTPYHPKCSQTFITFGRSLNHADADITYVEQEHDQALDIQGIKR